MSLFFKDQYERTIIKSRYSSGFNERYQITETSKPSIILCYDILLLTVTYLLYTTIFIIRTQKETRKIIIILEDLELDLHQWDALLCNRNNRVHVIYVTTFLLLNIRTYTNIRTFDTNNFYVLKTTSIKVVVALCRRTLRRNYCFCHSLNVRAVIPSGEIVTFRLAATMLGWPTGNSLYLLGREDGVPKAVWRWPFPSFHRPRSTV